MKKINILRGLCILTALMVFFDARWVISEDYLLAQWVGFISMTVALTTLHLTCTLEEYFKT